MDYVTKYKTELCKNWEINNSCPFRNHCVFAHGKGELRKIKRDKNYKTKLCKPFYTSGYCKYGARCMFIHDSKKSIYLNYLIKK